MKRLLLRGEMSLLICITDHNALRLRRICAGNEGVQEHFVGARRLALARTRKAQTANFIRPTLPDCWSSHATATCQSRSWNATRRHKPPAGSEQYSQGGYEASFGSYEIDDAHNFTFHVEGSAGADPYRQRPAARV